MPCHMNRLLVQLNDFLRFKTVQGVNFLLAKIANDGAIGIKNSDKFLLLKDCFLVYILI